MAQEIDLACRELGAALIARNSRVATVESCTGGGIAYCMTGQAGSSDWFDRCFVTYSNQAKMDMVGVAQYLLIEHGAVSQAVAEAMALGGVQCSEANYSIAVTGIAGPGGGSESKPVGTVCFGFAKQNVNGSAEILKIESALFAGDRAAIRQQSILFGLKGLLAQL